MSLRPATRLIALLFIPLLFSGHTLHAAPPTASDSSSVLAELLENEGARNALIEQLRNPSKAVNTSDAPDKEQASSEDDKSPSNSEVSDSKDSLARQLATLTAAAGENFKQQLATLATSVEALTHSDDKHRVDMSAIFRTASHLALLAFATFALFFYSASRRQVAVC